VLHLIGQAEDDMTLQMAAWRSPVAGTGGGDTALHIAAAAYEPEIVTLLIEHGAGVDEKNRRGARPLDYAADGIPGSHAWNPAG
jgi:hypothetical protein